MSDERDARIRAPVRWGLETGEPDPVPETSGSRELDAFRRRLVEDVQAARDER